MRIVVGTFWGKRGPVDGVAAEPQYLDISMPPGTRKSFPVDTYRTAFAYIFDGSANFRDASEPFGVKLEKEINGQEMHIRDQSGNRTMVIFGTGDEVVATSGDQGVRFLLVSGKLIQEPVAWHGPIVMNTKEEIRQALDDLQQSRFIRSSASVI